MDGKKIVSVIEAYEVVFQLHDVPKKRMDPSRNFGDLSKTELLAHAHFLCAGAKEYAVDPKRFGKANRHLTAIQMCLSFAGWYSLDELMNHNRDVSD